jgi:predicted AAA+ superfamily ATPase
MIDRYLSGEILARLNSGKALVIMGARQVGKTTLLKSLFADAIWLNGDNADTRVKLSNPNADVLRTEIGENKKVVIDEAQRIENIGLCAKIIIDQLPDVTLILSGSSSFDLANKINEPLTGRKWEWMMFPLSFSEMCKATSLATEMRLLDQRLLFGYYPEVVSNPGDQISLLKQLSSDFLYKDILTWENIQKPDKLERLLQALALQVGQLVSVHEIGKICGLNSTTVERYVSLLEKTFIIYRLGSFSRNLRNELNKSRKIYFYDNGLLNAVINQFKPLALRTDTGGLWENFLIAERTKYLAEQGIYANRYFWRTKDQAEIDYIEEINGDIFAYQFKWNPAAKAGFAPSFSAAYQPIKLSVIHRDNYAEWLSAKWIWSSHYR